VRLFILSTSSNNSFDNFYLLFEITIQGTITRNFIYCEHGYLDGSPNHIRPLNSGSDIDRDFIRFNLISDGDDIVIIQNVKTLDYLECGSIPYRENKKGTDNFPNWVRWRLVPSGKGYIIRCLENGWMVQARPPPFHLRPPNDESNPSYITWKIYYSV
jgi:hypothetical protein